MNNRQVTIDEFLYLLEHVAKVHLRFDEPIPEITISQIRIIKSCLERPFQTCFGFELYPNFLSKASFLFYTLCKGHHLTNGNKRMACLTVIYFFEKNNIELNLHLIDLRMLALRVAKSKSDDHKNVLKRIEKNLSVAMNSRNHSD